jgi:DNA-binding transcriptional regulator GbsR (MarR family)
MPEVHEDVINVKLAEVLNRDFGIDARAERVKGRRRPDIRCYYKGFIIGLEASYSKEDAERDARNRIEQGLADITMALWIKEKYKDMPERELVEVIKRSKFGVKIFAPLDILFLEKVIEKRAEPVTGWFEDIDLPMIKTIIENSVSFMIREEDIQELMKDMKSKFDDFIKTLNEIDRRVVGDLRKNLYDILYKLYGLSIAETEDPEVIFGHAALSILLSTVFYEHIRDVHPGLKPITEYVKSYGSIEGLKRAFEDLLKIDYRVAVELTIWILNALPPGLTQRIRNLIDLAVKIAANKNLLKRDFAGRVYHEITGDIALRKGFATFYTEIPGAYMLGTLAISSLLDMDERNPFDLNQEEARKIVERVKSVRVGDLACGSGTLLTASYSALMHMATTLKFYYDLEDVNLDDMGRTLVEEGIYGIDALRYASQITAMNLALVGSSTIEKENIYTIYLGYIPEKKQAWLGSLELLNNTGKVGGLLAFIEKGLRGVAERVTLEGMGNEFSIPTHFDMIIMNPPFTRPTYRGKKPPEEKRAFFGFIADEKIRDILRKRYEEVLNKISEDLKKIAQNAANCELKDDIPDEIKDIIKGGVDAKLRQYLNIGLAGEALPFLYLAYKYVNENGVIAFVLPRAALAGISWFLARILLASKFHLKYVIVSSDPKNGYNFSEGADLSETLLIAKRTDKHEPSEKTVFVILTKKPRTALEGVLAANSILEAKKKGIIQYSHEGVEFIMKIVDRRILLKHIDNWNRLVAIPEPILSDYVLKLLTEGLITIGEYDA